MVVQSLENLEKLRNSNCVSENLEKSGNVTQKSRNVLCIVANNDFQIWVPQIMSI